MKPRRKTRKQMNEAEQLMVTFEDGTEDLPSIRDIPLIKLAIDHVLAGTNAKDIRDSFVEAGFSCGMDRAYSVIKIAKQEIAKEGYKDFACNFSWAQSNLMDIHARALANNDDRMRVVVIKELIGLWQLDKPEEEKAEEITDEMIEAFEQKLLR